MGNGGVLSSWGQQPFVATKAKVQSDLAAAQANGAEGFVFVTNQELRLAERQDLSANWPDHIEIYHLERLTTVLDCPDMAGTRKQFLGIDSIEDGVGGQGGSGVIVGDRGTVIGGAWRYWWPWRQRWRRWQRFHTGG